MTKKVPGKKSPKRKKGPLASSLELPAQTLKLLHAFMLKSRVLEEALIRIYKRGESFFWIGGAGEEAFGVPLGLLVNKGRGHDHDWLHLHYRCTPTLIAMGMPMIDSIRIMMNKSTDTSTGGRNFSNHYCYPKWNVAPVSSPIEVQYQIAIGTSWAQQREGAKGISIVSGGDAGTAEGDFASCLVWASRPGKELPILITVQNNKWGISTNFDSQHGEKFIADRGKAFGIRTAVINGNDPIETYIRLEEEMEYIRKNSKPVLLEAYVSRLYGHSSATGANFISHEEDCLPIFEERLLRAGILKNGESQELRQQFEKEALEAADKVRTEPPPKPESIWDEVYADNENADWRKF